MEADKTYYANVKQFSKDLPLKRPTEVGKLYEDIFDESDEPSETAKTEKNKTEL